MFLIVFLYSFQVRLLSQSALPPSDASAVSYISRCSAAIHSPGSMFGNSPRSISNWIKRVNQTGNIESLRSKPGSGRPSRLTQEQKNEIRTVLQQLPEEHGIQGKSWNGKNLSSFISQRYGITLQIRACQRILSANI